MTQGSPFKEEEGACLLHMDFKQMYLMQQISATCCYAVKSVHTFSVIFPIVSKEFQKTISKSNTLIF